MKDLTALSPCPPAPNWHKTGKRSPGGFLICNRDHFHTSNMVGLAGPGSPRSLPSLHSLGLLTGFLGF